MDKYQELQQNIVRLMTLTQPPRLKFKPTDNKYLRHIKNLCRRHGITLYTGKDYQNYMLTCYDKSKEVMVDDDPNPIFALVGARAICIPRIYNKRTYFYALHEIGHIVTQQPNDGWRLFAASRLKKVTKYMVASEHKASSFAIKANKYATFAYVDRMAAWNQYGYIERFETDWKTKLRNRQRYMTFTERRRSSFWEVVPVVHDELNLTERQ